MSSLLVILCTHNPREEFLRETLEALRDQSVPVSAWQLLIVDNASTTPLSGRLDLSWHPGARIVREEKLGTAHARHRALLEAATAGAGVILFVDDDNVLERDYIARGLELSLTWPQLGCWGGQLLPRFGATPPPWIRNYLGYLAVTPLAADQWTNCVKSYDVVPPTAGCFIRPRVWQRYLEMIGQDPRRLTLGACGNVQVRGEDTDLVLTAVDLGLGVGRFRDLKLTHLIPADRLTPAYVTNLIEGATFGTGLMEYLRFRRIPHLPAKGWFNHSLLHWRAWRLPEPIRSIRRAELRGRSAARRLVLQWQAEPPPSAPAPLPAALGA